MKRTSFDLVACPTCHGKLSSYCADRNADPCLTGNLYCKDCSTNYSILEGIPYFIEPEDLIGSNRRASHLGSWFSWGNAAFSKVAFACIGMNEAAARREITKNLAPRGGKVLEVSTGTGVNLPSLISRQDVSEVFGLDTSPAHLKLCQSMLHHKSWAVDLFLGNEEQLPFQDASFDSVFHVGGLNFINNKKTAIEEMIRVAKPGGHILIAGQTKASPVRNLFPGFKSSFRGSQKLIATGRMPCFSSQPAHSVWWSKTPIEFIPPQMLERRVFDVWKGWLRCLEFRRPM